MKNQIRIATLSLLVLVCLALSVVPASAQLLNLYDNGPVNGQVAGWQINSGFSVSDSFTVSTGSNDSQINGAGPPATRVGGELENVTFSAWVSPGDTLTSVGVQIGTSAFDNSLFDGMVSLTQASCLTNNFGFDVCTETGNFNGPTLANGNYWLTLSNATDTSGSPVLWDENSGVGCQSSGCPSQGQASGIGSIPSESFDLSGTTVAGGSTPEPGTLALLGTGVGGLAVLLRRKRSL
ncbi:MAG: PEP-CTERM sorting domain-containing protein [Candidatus Korobacteraceae bacterium]